MSQVSTLSLGSFDWYLEAVLMKNSNARCLRVCTGCGTAMCAACFDFYAPLHRRRPGNEKREEKLKKIREILQSQSS